MRNSQYESAGELGPNDPGLSLPRTCRIGSPDGSVGTKAGSAATRRDGNDQVHTNTSVLNDQTHVAK